MKLLQNSKTYNEYSQVNQNGASTYNLIYENTENEDKYDRVYGYGSNYSPEVFVSGVDDLTEFFIENEIQSITHFWDADNFTLNETYGHDIEHGEMYGGSYSINNIPSAVTKAYAILFGVYSELILREEKWISWSTEQAFRTVTGNQIWLNSPTKEFFFSNKDFQDFQDNYKVFIVGRTNEAGQYAEYNPPYYVQLTQQQYDNFVNQNPHIFINHKQFHSAGKKKFIGWSSEQAFRTVDGNQIWLNSPVQEFFFSLWSIEDYIINHNVVIVGRTNEAGQYAEYNPPYYVKLTEEQFQKFKELTPFWEYEYLGRLIHLLQDMTVPAHVHNDNHGPEWTGSEWNTSSCDEYEGWKIGSPVYGEGGYLKDNTSNLYWDAGKTLKEYGGLLDIGTDYSDPLYIFNLFYTLNQITDMFASDDVPGDFKLHNDYPITNYPIIQETQENFINEILLECPNIQNRHEIRDSSERIAIRDMCVPLAIRGVATLLDWYAYHRGFVSLPSNNMQLFRFDYCTSEYLANISITTSEKFIVPEECSCILHVTNEYYSNEKKIRLLPNTLIKRGAFFNASIMR
jgi:hypothetical protein